MLNFIFFALIFQILAMPSSLWAAPTANSTRLTLNEDSTRTVKLSASADRPYTITAFRIVMGPANGIHSLSGNELTYTPGANYFGSDRIIFRAIDSHGTESADATLSITVNAVNDSPIISGESSYSGQEDQSFNFRLNASDIDGDSVTCSLQGSVDFANVSVSSDCNVAISPKANYSGGSSITVRSYDGRLYSSSLTVPITINAVNDIPVVSDKSKTLNEDMPTTISLYAQDVEGDTITFSVITPPQHGTAVINGQELTYTPASNYSGSDTIVYKASDGQGHASANIALTINAVVDAPVANDLSVTAHANYPVNSITLNGTDADGDELTYQIISTPSHGSLGTIEGNQLNYVPDLNYNGPDTFTYSVNDGRTNSANGTVSITVANSNLSNTLSLEIARPETTVSTKNLLGLIGAGAQSGLGAISRDYTTIFQNIGINEWRNNDPNDGTFDLESYFNCTGTYGGTCASDRNGQQEYPCWSTCTPLSVNDPSMLLNGSSGPNHHERMQKIKDAGFGLFWRMGGSWSDSVTKMMGVPNDNCSGNSSIESDGHSFKGPQSTNEEDNAIQGMRFAVEYADQNFGADFLPYLNFWTEYPNQHFYDLDSLSGCGSTGEDVSDLRFITFFSKGISRLKEYFPEKKVGGPGLRGLVGNGPDEGAYEFLNQLYQLRETYNTRLDFLDWHYFGSDPAEFQSQLIQLNDLLKAQGEYDNAPWAESGYFEQTEIVVGAYHSDANSYLETNSEDYAPATCQELRTGGLGGAYQGAMWTSMQYQSNVVKSFFYRGIDSDDYNASADATNCASAEAGYQGIIYSQEESADATHSIYKPIANVMRLQARMAREFPNQMSNNYGGSDAYGKVWAYAAEDALGRQKSILLSNMSDSAWTWNLRLAQDNKIFPLNRYQIDVFQVDDTNDGQSVVANYAKGTTSTLVVPAKTVQLIILKP